MLVFEAPSRENATRFLRGDRDVSLSSAEPLFARWSRAVGLGVQADAAAYPEGTSDADLVTRRARLAEVFREKAGMLKPLSDRLAARTFVAVIADPEGVLLATAAPSAHDAGLLDDPAVRLRITPGATWSEAARGTNAIGTAIAEGQPVAVIGAAHYEIRNHGIFCYGHPIFDAYGDLVCVLDVTGAVEHHDRAIGDEVSAAASSLEQVLRRLAYAQSGAGTLAMIERLIHRSGSATLLVEASGRVASLNDHARELLGPSARTPLSCQRLFGLGFAELGRLALEGRADLRFEMGAHKLRVELDPIGGTAGRTFAIVVHLDGFAAQRSRHRTSESLAMGSSKAAVDTPFLQGTQPHVQPPAPASQAERAERAGGAGPVTRARHVAFSPVFGSDAALSAAKDAASRFAATDLPVLLLAETGTGKELFARAIHGASARAGGPFVALNCGALASGVLESELFGHAPHSFTGASRHGADGKIAAANGGTLFLDEIAEMPDAVQTALLRVLDHGGAHYRVGDTRPRQSDFRLVCATCRDLPELVERGAFRRDLFFRIHGACVSLPALRERSDRVELAAELLARVLPRLPRTPPRLLRSEREGCETDLAESARAWILEHDWPGNVRELKSALVHAVAMADGGVLEAEHFPRVLVGLSSRTAPVAAPVDARAPSRSEGAVVRTRVAIFEQAIQDALRASAGNVSEAARRLGIARSTVYRAVRSKLI